MTNLWGTGPARGGRVDLDPGRPCFLRITGLTGEMCATLEETLPEAGEQLTLEGGVLGVTEVATTTDEHPLNQANHEFAHIERALRAHEVPLVKGWAEYGAGYALDETVAFEGERSIRVTVDTPVGPVPGLR